jgi:hypothetical protein
MPKSAECPTAQRRTSVKTGTANCVQFAVLPSRIPRLGSSPFLRATVQWIDAKPAPSYLQIGGFPAPGAEGTPMPIPAILSRKLYETLGHEGAEAMVDWMNNMESSRSELRELADLGFARIDARFGEAEARFDARFAEMDARVDARFAEMDARVDARFAEMDARVDVRFAEMGARVDARFANTDARIDKLESTLRQEMHAEFGELREGLSRLEAKMERRFGDLIKWSFVFWVGSSVTLLVALATLQRLGR